jgi:hypothetical protein
VRRSQGSRSEAFARKVKAMGLTWKDLVTTVSMGVIAAGYAAFLPGTGAWLISSARGTTLAVFVGHPRGH